MKVIRGVEELPPSGRHRVVAIGSFDGVHLGHRRIIERAVEESRATGGESLVLTFDPHPLTVLAPRDKPALLTTAGEKARLLEELGVELLLVLPFDNRLARMSPEDFSLHLLARRIGVHLVMVGYNFTFGHQGAGDTELLGRLGRRHGYGVKVFPPITVDGEPVSSTIIRQYLAAGAVERAASLLGRYYSLPGRVEPGDGRGRELGFPTANLSWPDEKLIPGCGVYAVQVALEDGPCLPGVAHIGRRPTFGGGEVAVEVHLLDYRGHLYGRYLEVSFVEKIREERAFPGPAELVRQIRRDVESARRALIYKQRGL